MKRFARILSVALSAVIPSSLLADMVSMKSGRDYEGVVLQDTADAVVLKLAYGTVTLPRESIAKVVKAPVASPATRPSMTAFKSWDEIVTRVAATPWAIGFQQIPATVIDLGQMRAVPYQSYRFANTEFELNVYGDPDNPCCIEVGVYGATADTLTAKQRCIDLATSFLTDSTNSKIVSALNLEKDLVRRDPLTFEITPRTAPDAYGGWWISIYDEAALEKARATKAELAAITTPKPAAPPVVRTPATPAKESSAVTDVDQLDSYNPSSYTYSRSSSASAAGSSGGSVYVRGYTRKDGTYVRPHTRSSSGGRR